MARVASTLTKPQRDELLQLAERIVGESLQQAKRERDDEREHARELQRQLADAQRELERLQRENDDIREQLRVVAAAAEAAVAESADSAGGEAGEPEFRSVGEAVEQAAKLRGLRFLQEAVQSANESPFERPGELYGAFVLLSQLASLRLTGSVGMSVEEWLLAAGVEYARHLGQAKEMAKFRSQYTFRVNGERTVFEEHLKFGNGRDPHHSLRVYMKWQADEGEWIIGHVGRHLKNANT